MTAHIESFSIFPGEWRSSLVARADLGKEMAVGLAEAGASLMLCARREQWLTPTVNECALAGFALRYDL